MSYDGLLLDHDGVLVTLAGRETLRRAARDAFASAGVDDPRPADVDAITIHVDREAVVAAGRRYGVDPAELWRHRDDEIRNALRTATVEGRKVPYEDVDALADPDVPLGVVSNNQARVVSFVLDHHGLDSLFDAVHAREPTLASLDRKKPRPTLLRAAVDELAVSNPLYVGDSESDVLAARRAGLDVAFLRREHNADRSLDASATHDVTGLDDVTALLG
jgi:HAD superfamily hydrolase (TIGR01549 family)